MPLSPTALALGYKEHPTGALKNYTVANDNTEITAALLDALGGITTPTGTGLRKVAGGVENAAASLLVDADVAVGADIAQSKVAGLVSALAAKASISYVDTTIANLIGAAPALLDTLSELSDALGDDANFAATMTTALAGKVPSTQVTGGGVLATGGFTLTVPATGTAVIKNGVPANNYVATWSDANGIEGDQYFYHANGSVGIAASAQTNNVILSMITAGAIGGTGGQVQFNLTDNATQAAQFLANLSLPVGFRYIGFIAKKDRDGNQLPFQIYSHSASDVVTLGLTVGHAAAAGKVGIGLVNAPTAYLHLPAGGLAASSAQLKFTTGSLQTTAEAGTMSYDNDWHLTRSDAVRRMVVLSTVKRTLGRQQLTDAATVAVDSSLGDVYDLSSAVARTIGVPTGTPQDGWTMLFRFVNTSGGAITHTLTTGSAGAFRYSTDITVLPAIAASKELHVGVRYNATANRWDVEGTNNGY